MKCGSCIVGSSNLVLLQMSAEEELQWLRGQLKECEKQLQKAAQAGLDLLNQQVELQSRLDEQRVEMTNTLEVCTQPSCSH